MACTCDIHCFNSLRGELPAECGEHDIYAVQAQVSTTPRAAGPRRMVNALYLPDGPALVRSSVKVAFSITLLGEPSVDNQRRNSVIAGAGPSASPTCTIPEDSNDMRRVRTKHAQTGHSAHLHVPRASRQVHCARNPGCPPLLPWPPCAHERTHPARGHILHTSMPPTQHQHLCRYRHPQMPQTSTTWYTHTRLERSVLCAVR